jgi:transcriptional regulator with XRE-family HTH domain
MHPDLHTDSRQNLATNVRRLRTELDWSQEQLGFEANINRTYISGIEKGLRNPTINVIDRLAKALYVPTHVLLMGEE